MTLGIYAQVNGREIYYALRGRGRPPVLLLGGPGAIGVFGQP